MPRKIWRAFLYWTPIGWILLLLWLIIRWGIQLGGNALIVLLLATAIVGPFVGFYFGWQWIRSLAMHIVSPDAVDCLALPATIIMVVIIWGIAALLFHFLTARRA